MWIAWSDCCALPERLTESLLQHTDVPSFAVPAATTVERLTCGVLAALVAALHSEQPSATSHAHVGQRHSLVSLLSQLIECGSRNRMVERGDSGQLHIQKSQPGPKYELLHRGAKSHVCRDS